MERLERLDQLFFSLAQGYGVSILVATALIFALWFLRQNMTEKTKRKSIIAYTFVVAGPPLSLATCVGLCLIAKIIQDYIV